MIYVLSKEGKPLMPCCAVVGRLLLKQGKAKVKSTAPFTIQLANKTTNCTQPLTLGIDTGSAIIGSAVVNNKNEVFYISETTIRNDIAEKMTRRAKYRRNRRNRKTRYRKPRWLNRRNSIKTGRFSPTMRSKIDSHIKEIRKVYSILPITHLIIETGNFDPHAIKNPEVLTNPLLYQQGINYGYANTKAYVLDRDDHKCQNKKCTSKNKRIEVHHIVFRSNNGSDEPENLIALCKDCHDGLHDGTIVLKLTGKKKGDLKHATQMNSIRTQLMKLFPHAEETFGFKTKEHRQHMGLCKGHYIDAVVIATDSIDKPIFKTNTLLIKKSVSDGDFQLYKGIRSEQAIPVRKIAGFRKFDRIKYKGRTYFIKGRMSTGYAVLMDIDGTKSQLSPTPKFTLMKRVGARKTWMTYTKKITTNNAA
jgi:hypothetical protein